MQKWIQSRGGGLTDIICFGVQHKSIIIILLLFIWQNQVWRKCEYLIDALNRNGQQELALEYIPTMVDSTHMTDAVQLWVKLKGDLVKHNKSAVVSM